MTPQTSSPIPEIRRFGCYFYVMLHFAEQIQKRQLSENQILTLYRKLQTVKNWNGTLPAMTKNCKLNDPEAVTNLAIAELGGADCVKQIGIEQGGRVALWGWVAKGTKPDFTVEEWETPYGSHFICADFNPDPTIKLKKLIKRIYYKRY